MHIPGERQPGENVLRARRDLYARQPLSFNVDVTYSARTIDAARGDLEESSLPCERYTSERVFDRRGSSTCSVELTLVVWKSSNYGF